MIRCKGGLDQRNWW
uniref:Uncharacterized protein n=1 Tax=Arundo donax TaxID=35708 RepID=A0A0A9CJQ5_ARUDO